VLSIALALGALLLFQRFVHPSDAGPDPDHGRVGAVQPGTARRAIPRSDGKPTSPPDTFSSPFDSNLAPPDPALDHQAFLPLIRSTGLMTEARALWVTRWDYSTITDVQTLVEDAAGSGFNILLFQVRGTADAFYTPGLEPWAARLGGGTLGEDPGWDPLQTAIEAAHALGLELHAYINVYPVWSGQTAPPTAATPQHLFWTLSYSYTWDNWRIVDADGVTMTLSGGYLWATPALTDVVDRVVSVTKDLVTRYDVDGIHLDVVRYPGSDTSYDPFSNAGYESALTRDPDLTRADWQRRQVTGLVERVYAEAVEPRSDLRLSAAVWPIYQDRWGWGYKTGYSDFYQDSQGWVQSGTIDAIVPMLYTGMFISYPKALTPTQFSLVASDFLAHDGGRHVFPGISAENLDFAAVTERIDIARDLGAPGHAIFSAGELARKGYWDELASGPYAPEAVIPPMTWRMGRASER
jgi:uncharacterized lipoprotein YddW (UPF0748 family)